MVRHTFQIGHQVIEDKALGEQAYTVLQPVHMAQLHLVTEDVDTLLQGLHPVCALNVVVLKAVERQPYHIVHGGGQNTQLLPRRRGKYQFLFPDLPGCFGNIHGMVADAFKIAERVQIFGNALVLKFVQLMGVDADQIGSQSILVLVNLVLALLHAVESLLAVMGQQIKGVQEVLPGGVGHVVDSQAALFDGQRRMGKKALVQSVQGGVYAALLIADLYDIFHESQQKTVERQQDGHAQGAENGVDQSHAHRIHDKARKAQIHKGGYAVIQKGTDRHSGDLNDQIQKGGAPALGLCAQSGQQYRHRRADGNAQNQRIGGGKGDGSGHRQGL